ncbi:preprotein translocase subunit YajC [Sporanaerobacter sp. PP17-6a]|jgi:preprotein translocase YajC subunit|uniref:preprotein translocase subunit YajC n=1 Tax=Sporanaerobacter sp. PP17-6a TaxID=1891289 RepID=UPI0008A06466|nr:preprotein translocase subunit YajC [Sporanaerobacter sp. PP17-6a]SCL94792.1 preprotein translocase subunit YajC [Sporanaerobacter sp. PP17-6a]
MNNIIWDKFVNDSLVVGIILIIWWIISDFVRRLRLKKAEEKFKLLQGEIKPGINVLLANGIIGKVKTNEGEFIKIQIAEGVEITCSRYAIQSIFKG